MEERQTKLTWFPLYFERFLSSPSWHRMSDYQRGWYVQLLFLSANSERPGYLLSDDCLWRLVGAHSKQFFDKEAAVVLARFKSRQIDGRVWIYNEQMVKLLQEQTAKHEEATRKFCEKRSAKKEKNKENHSFSFSVVSPEALNQTIEDLFAMYMKLL